MHQRAIAIVLALSLVPAIHAQTYDIDTFDDTDFADGVPFLWLPGPEIGGDRDASSGDFLISTELGVQSMTDLAGETYANVSGTIRTQLLELQRAPMGNSHGLYAFFPNSNAVYWGIIDPDGEANIWRFLDNRGTLLSSASTSVDPMSSNTWLEFSHLADNMALRVWSDGDGRPTEPNVRVRDEHIDGDLNLGLWVDEGMSVVFRSFEVSEVIRDAADMDLDGLVNETDFASLCRQVRNGTGPDHFDLDGDGAIDTADIGFFFESAGWIPGDIDLDGNVEFADFLTLSVNFGVTSASWGDGDFDCDGEVAFADFLQLSANFGSSSRDSPESVPEPSGTAMYLPMLVVLCLRRRRDN